MKKSLWLRLIGFVLGGLGLVLLRQVKLGGLEVGLVVGGAMYAWEFLVVRPLSKSPTSLESPISSVPSSHRRVAVNQTVDGVAPPTALAAAQQTPEIERAIPYSADAAINDSKVPREEFWAEAAMEFDGPARRPGLWAMVFSNAHGNEASAKAGYLRARATELQAELDASVAKDASEAQQAVADAKALREAAADRRRGADLSRFRPFGGSFSDAVAIAETLGYQVTEHGLGWLLSTIVARDSDGTSKLFDDRPSFVAWAKTFLDLPVVARSGVEQISKPGPLSSS